MIQAIHHTAISTPNLERAIAFYRDLFGFEVVQEFAWPRGSEQADRILGVEDTEASAAMLRRGNSMIEIFQFSSPRPKPGDPRRPVCNHGITHICFAVKNIQEEFERLQERGMSFHCPPQGNGSGLAATYGRDPDGNVIELLEASDPRHPFHLTN
jgi:catechol 2,3-dioxygenase-like lactoylglutathione lyase family enzyme